MTPDEEFTIAFRRMNNGWAIIYSLRMVSTAGMPYAAKVVEVEHTSVVSDLTNSGDLKKFIIGIVDDDDLKKTADFVSQKLTEQTLKNASSSVDAASLLFAHSVLEDGLNSFLAVAWVHCLFVATFQSLDHIAKNVLWCLFSVWLKSERYAANYLLIRIFPFRHCSLPVDK